MKSTHYPSEVLQSPTVETVLIICFSAKARQSMTVFHCLNIVFDGVHLLQKIQLRITESECSKYLLVWERQAHIMPGVQTGTAGDGSRRGPLLISQRCEG